MLARWDLWAIRIARGHQQQITVPVTGGRLMRIGWFADGAYFRMLHEWIGGVTGLGLSMQFR